MTTRTIWVVVESESWVPGYVDIKTAYTDEKLAKHHAREGNEGRSGRGLYLEVIDMELVEFHDTVDTEDDDRSRSSCSLLPRETCNADV